MPEREDPLTRVPHPRWRRPMLLVTGVSLLTLGAFVNAERIGLGSDDRSRASELSSAGASAPELSSTPELLEPPAEHEEVVPHEGEAGAMGQPSGGAYAVGSEDSEIWGGLTASSYGVGGLGLSGFGRGGGGVGGEGIGLGYAAPRRDTATERYAGLISNEFKQTKADPQSTFSIDVDTASYSNVRRFLLTNEQLPPAASVRTEELINYFDYDYLAPSGDSPFSLTTEVGPCPWNAANRLVHVGLQAKLLDPRDTPPRNLVFLIDVSGSMSPADRLPLIKHGLASLTEQLGPDDRVSIVVYAGAAGIVLPPTSGADKHTILAALDALESGGGTNGAQGIEAAYDLAERSFIAGGVNRVLLATDGDFNVGVSSHDALIRLIEEKRESGVFLSVLGVGTGNLNDHMMEQIADKGNGNYAYIDGMLEARKVLVEQSGATLVTVAKDVKIQVEFDAAQVAQHRLIGYENRVMAHHEFDDDRKDAGEIGAGHTVTAIYEITPTERPDWRPKGAGRAGSREGRSPEGGDMRRIAASLDDHPLMLLNVRYKQPDGDHSEKLTVEVPAGQRPLAQTSDDYRFSAAVAAFGSALRGADELSYAAILSLAEGSLGADSRCYRHQFLELVWAAGRLAGEQFDAPDFSCTPQAQAPRRQAPEAQASPVLSAAPELSAAPSERLGWQAFALEVLRLLPPFLALPLFVMALRRPRRRR